jgi:hypothetical protein
LRNLRWISECERHFPAAESEGLCPNVRNRDDIYSVAALDVIFYDNAAVAGFRVPANGKLAPMVQKPSQSRPTERQCRGADFETSDFASFEVREECILHARGFRDATGGMSAPQWSGPARYFRTLESSSIMPNQRPDAFPGTSRFSCKQSVRPPEDELQDIAELRRVKSHLTLILK